MSARTAARSGGPGPLPMAGQTTQDETGLFTIHTAMSHDHQPMTDPSAPWHANPAGATPSAVQVKLAIQYGTSRTRWREGLFRQENGAVTLRFALPLLAGGQGNGKCRHCTQARVRARTRAAPQCFALLTARLCSRRKHDSRCTVYFLPPSINSLCQDVSRERRSNCRERPLTPELRHDRNSPLITSPKLSDVFNDV